MPEKIFIKLKRDVRANNRYDEQREHIKQNIIIFRALTIFLAHPLFLSTTYLHYKTITVHDTKVHDTNYREHVIIIINI